MPPRLLDALTMMFGTGPRFSVPHAASILRVDADRLYAVLALLEKVQLVTVAARATPQEEWHATIGDASMKELLARIEELVATGELPVRILETPLA